MSWAITAGPVLPVLIGGFVVALVISLVSTPWLRRYFQDHRVLDHPDARRVHKQPLPRGGGVAVVVAFVLVGGGLALLRDSLPGVAQARSIPVENLLGLFGGGILATLIGAVDDRFDLRARWQFLGQLALAGIAVYAGISVTHVSNPFGSGDIDFPDVVAIGFTVVWIVGMINSLNFIDGLDGLSSGVAAIAAVTLGVISLTDKVNQPLVAVLCFVLAGGLVGFLRWNFHPAVIFQGTAGVMFLGFTLAVLAILGTAKVLVALLVLAVPIVDTFWVIVRRVFAGQSPFTPDRGHIHHLLLGLGLSHRSTVLLIYGVCATLGLMSLFVSSTTGLIAFVGALVVLGVVAFLLRRGPSEVAS